MIKELASATPSRIFSLDDQLAFARLSGDFNPLHIDPVISRRTLFGRPIVHGVHMLLWALNNFLPPATYLTKINASFNTPLGVGEPLIARTLRSDATSMTIVLESNGGKLSTIKAAFETHTPVDIDSSKNGFPPRLHCQELDASLISTAQGEVKLFVDTVAVELILPGLIGCLNLTQIATILATTRVVGMECPGLNSVFVALQLRFEKSVEKSVSVLKWKVQNFEDQFNRTLIKVEAPGAQGTLETFLRPTAHSQPTIESLRRVVSPNQFAGQRALVIGGSRGLGELTAKLLAAGGAEIRLTYNQGKKDAENVISDIEKGGGRGMAAAFDVTQPEASFGLLVDEIWFPTHVYHFSTPPIFVGHKGVYNEELYRKFAVFYVEGVQVIYDALRKVSREPFTLFYPSSVAVDEAPDGMEEYAAAKNQGELLAQNLAVSDRTITVRVSRLPRLSTDQTATLMHVQAEDNVEVLLRMLLDQA